MSDSLIKELRQFVSAAGLKEIDGWIAKYPCDQKQSAVMSSLMIIQQEHGYLSPESMESLAAYLEMPAIAVYEVANFYSMYERKPTGRHMINVCTNISCKLRDSATIVGHLESKLSIKVGDTTEDGRFTLRSVECLGACVHAPMMQVDKDYHEHLTPEKVDTILDDYV